MMKIRRVQETIGENIDVYRRVFQRQRHMLLGLQMDAATDSMPS